MVTPISAESLLGEEREERELEELRSQVQREKEKVSKHFHQLHLLLAAREESVLLELDEIVDRVRRELSEKRALLQQLNTAREGLERDLTENKLRELLQKNLRSLEDGIGEVLEGRGGGVTVGLLEVEWNVEGVEFAVSDVCKVLCLKEKPVERVDYSLKVRPVWSRITGGRGPDQISIPMQIAIDNATQNIFVTDLDCPRVQVFDSDGNHLYSITDGIRVGSTGIALTNEFIFVMNGSNLLKLNKSTNRLIESVRTENAIWGIEVDKQTNIYGCEYENQSIVVFDRNLKFLRRIKLKSTHLQPTNENNSMKLYQNNMYVMFGPNFHLQVFSLEGDLMRCLIPKEEIDFTYFFSIDEVGNIIVADWGGNGNQIKILNNEGETIHTITNSSLAENEKLVSPYGVALDKSNKIIVAQTNPEGCLQAF